VAAPLETWNDEWHCMAVEEVWDSRPAPRGLALARRFPGKNTRLSAAPFLPTRRGESDASFSPGLLRLVFGAPAASFRPIVAPFIILPTKNGTDEQKRH